MGHFERSFSSMAGWVFGFLFVFSPLSFVYASWSIIILWKAVQYGGFSCFT